MLFSEFLRSKDQKYYENWTKDAVFVYILGFIFYSVSRAKTDLHDKYMIQLCAWLIFWTRSSIKLIYFGSLCEKIT